MIREHLGQSDDQGSGDPLDTLRILELSQQAHSLYIEQNPEKQRKLLDTLLSNSELKGSEERPFLLAVDKSHLRRCVDVLHLPGFVDALGNQRSYIAELEMRSAKSRGARASVASHCGTKPWFFTREPNSCSLNLATRTVVYCYPPLVPRAGLCSSTQNSSRDENHGR